MGLPTEQEILIFQKKINIILYCWPEDEDNYVNFFVNNSKNSLCKSKI